VTAPGLLQSRQELQLTEQRPPLLVDMTHGAQLLQMTARPLEVHQREGGLLRARRHAARATVQLHTQVLNHLTHLQLAVVHR